MGSGLSHPSCLSAYFFNGDMDKNKMNGKIISCSNNDYSCFQMPLHYPRFKKSDYEKMPEWQLNHLLGEYGLPVIGDVTQKRKFAIGAFLWPQENAQ